MWKSMKSCLTNYQTKFQNNTINSKKDTWILKVAVYKFVRVYMWSYIFVTYMGFGWVRNLLRSCRLHQRSMLLIALFVTHLCVISVNQFFIFKKCYIINCILIKTCIRHLLAWHSSFIKMTFTQQLLYCFPLYSTNELQPM